MSDLFMFDAKEYKVLCLRETPLPNDLQVCDTPEKAAEYWRGTVQKADWYREEQECLVVLFLNTRKRVTGYNLVSLGSMDTIMVHPREVFRAAIVASAASIILMHNHPSGDSSPSTADIKVTGDLRRAGQLIKIEVMDHVIVGRGEHTSLRTLGYFY